MIDVSIWIELLKAFKKNTYSNELRGEWEIE